MPERITDIGERARLGSSDHEMILESMEERRHQADMLQMYILITRKDNMDSASWFEMAAGT
jgi:hypothetical protein